MARSFAASGASTSELHARRLFELAAIGAEIEEIALAESEHARKQRRRKTLDAGVVFLHRVVEEAPRRRELVLEVGQFALQLLEVRARFEVGIGLAEREQPADCAGKLVL